MKISQFHFLQFTSGYWSSVTRVERGSIMTRQWSRRFECPGSSSGLSKGFIFLHCAFWPTQNSLNPLTPNDPYSGRTASLTSERCILYIYSTNISTEYFKHGIYSPFFSSSKCSLFHNCNAFGSCIIHILYTGCAKI